MKILSLLTILILVSCASDKPKGKTEAEILYKEAKILMDDERYILATEKLNNLKNQYPYSYYATPAELMQADILFLQENYVEAAAAYLLFRDFHPKHEKIAYVIYKIAESYYLQLPDTDDRDLEPAVEAIKYYDELLTKYASSSYTKDAKKKINECKTRLMNKEKYVADFYFKTESYEAARWRYLDSLNLFTDKKYRSHSMKRVVLSTYFLKEYEKCIAYANNYSQHLEKSDRKKVDEYLLYCKNKIN
jgi:outer membrane protein assembly factor BamD